MTTEQISRETYEELEGIGADPEPRPRHYRHPINPDRTWCDQGTTTPADTTYHDAPVRHTDTITCPACLHLYINKGGNWWWHIHNAWYQTNCTPQTGHKGCK